MLIIIYGVFFLRFIHVFYIGEASPNETKYYGLPATGHSLYKKRAET